jgi:hypothetical protein
MVRDKINDDVIPAIPPLHEASAIRAETALLICLTFRLPSFFRATIQDDLDVQVIGEFVG